MEKIVNQSPRYQDSNVTVSNKYQKTFSLLRSLKLVVIFRKAVRFFYNKVIAYLNLNHQFISHKYFFKERSFDYQGEKYEYFTHKYNTTWDNERKVEVPIVNKYLQDYKGKDILEVGNVISHYLDVGHDIVDKFEVYKNVINEDILTYNPSIKYDLIVSISTLEHVGWDDTEQDPDKIIKVVESLISLKKDEGKIIITAPLGYNPNLDNMLREGILPFSKILCLKRISKKGEWIETPFDKKEIFKYGLPFPCANTIFIGII